MVVVEISGKAEIKSESMWILQQGFYLEGKPGSSIREFLLESCNIPETYISEKIKTVFLSGKPVDNLDDATVTKDSILAISGALPGLVGAMMRIDSFYAPLRSSITHQSNEENSITKKTSLIKMKLFNKTLSDMGPKILENGIILPLESIIELLLELKEKKNVSPFEITINNKVLAPDINTFQKMFSTEKYIKIIFSHSNEENSR